MHYSSACCLIVYVCLCVLTSCKLFYVVTALAAALSLVALFATLATGQFTFSPEVAAKFTFPAPPAPSSNALLGNSLIAGTANNGDIEPCTCAAFLSGQFKKGSSEQPIGLPALIQETDLIFPCTQAGLRLCINKCLETIVKHLPNSPAIICGTIDRDCHRERAYLWVKNCDANQWINSNLSAGREYCCKSGEPVSCLDPFKLN